MQPFRFVHAADLHIDSPLTGLKSRNEIVGRRVQEAGYEALSNLVELCIEEQVDFLLVAGDVYDSAVRAPVAQLRFRDALARLADAGIESFVVHGNHDPLDGRYTSIEWPDGVRVFGESPEWKTAFRGDAPIAHIQGVSYPHRDVTENLAAQFAAPPDSDLFSIGLLHCNLGNDPAHPNYAPCTMDDLRARGIDYWALGHIHRKQVWQQPFSTVVYPGNIQARDAGEPGARGCYLVEVDAGGRASLEFRALDAVRWDLIEVSINGLQGIDQLERRLQDSLEESLRAADGRDVVCRITLTGRGPLHADLADAGAIEDLLEYIRGNLAGGSPWIWVERVENQTRPDIDLDALASRDGFLGDLQRRAIAANAAPSEFGEGLAAVFSGRRDGLPPLSDARIGELIEEARWYLAELLEPGDAPPAGR